jgi:maltose O-acetyltransferase
MRERMLRGELYIGSDTDSAAEFGRARELLAEFNDAPPGAWLGGGVIVSPGVSIGQDTVVGAGAVVTKDLPAGVVAVGVPARILREIGDEDRIEVPER